MKINNCCSNSNNIKQETNIKEKKKYFHYDMEDENLILNIKNRMFSEAQDHITKPIRKISYLNIEDMINDGINPENAKSTINDGINPENAKSIRE